MFVNIGDCIFRHIYLYDAINIMHIKRSSCSNQNMIEDARRYSIIARDGARHRDG